MYGVIFINTGEVIKKLRNRENLTQEQLGHILGVKKSAIQKYENGSIQNFKIETIRLLCETFKVPPYYFIYPNYYDVNENRKDELQDKEFHDKLNKYFGGTSPILLRFWVNLNDKNREKVVQYAYDLSKIDEYRR